MSAGRDRRPAAARAPRRPRPAPERDRDTEQRILDAAHGVFVRRGTAGARMQEIAAAAGVNQALLHYYFRSKDRLAHTAFERARGTVHAGGDPGARVRRGARRQGVAHRPARARSSVPHAVPARLHHQRGHAPSRAGASAHRRDHRPDAGGRAAAGDHHAAPADRRARPPRHDARDRARAVHRQPDVAVRVSVRRAADDRGDARRRSARLRAVHRQTPSRISRRSFLERCGHESRRLRGSRGAGCSGPPCRP